MAQSVELKSGDGRLGHDLRVVGSVPPPNPHVGLHAK